jgi:hypothetical protein
MFCVLDVLGFRRFCFGHILDVLGLDVLGLDVLVLDVLGEHGITQPTKKSPGTEKIVFFTTLVYREIDR